MKAVWQVRSRDLESRMRYWTAIVGYDPRDPSVSQRIYLIYLVIFFSMWGFAVLSLLANLGVEVLTLVKGLTPPKASVLIMAVTLLIDATIRGYMSGKRSPFIFSDADAELICQTPVDRRQVALTWCLGAWLPADLVLGALAVILRFASIQLTEHGGIVWAHLASYLLAGLQTICIIIPLHMAFMGMVFTLGALRLRDNKDNPWLRWIPVGAAMALISLVLFGRRSVQVVLWPLLFPLEAGFGEENWLVGFILAVILAMAGILALYWASSRLNLSRAAQESRFRWAAQRVSMLGDSNLYHQMKTRQRLGAGHQASRIPGRAGYTVLIWKDAVTTLRTMNFGHVMGWLGIFGVFLGMMLAPDWGARIWAFILWTLWVGQQCTEGLRADLKAWTITRQLPFTGRETLVAQFALPVIGASLLSWLAFGVSTWLGFHPQISLILMAPVGIISVVLAATLDILRHCRSSNLLAGLVPALGAGGLGLGILLAGIPLILITWITSEFNTPGIIWLVPLLGLVICAGIVYVLWVVTGTIYRAID